MLLHLRQHPCPLSHYKAMTLPGLRLPASASLPLASRWPRPQQLLPVSAAGGGRRRCPKGRGFGRPGHSELDAGGPIWRKRAGLAYGASGFWTTHLVKLSLAWTAEHYRSRDIVLRSSRRKLTDMPRALPLGELANEVRLRGQARDKRASARR